MLFQVSNLQYPPTSSNITIWMTIPQELATKESLMQGAPGPWSFPMRWPWEDLLYHVPKDCWRSASFLDRISASRSELYFFRHNSRGWSIKKLEYVTEIGVDYNDATVIVLECSSSMGGTNTQIQFAVPHEFGSLFFCSLLSSFFVEHPLFSAVQHLGRSGTSWTSQTGNAEMPLARQPSLFHWMSISSSLTLVERKSTNIAVTIQN